MKVAIREMSFLRFRKEYPLEPILKRAAEAGYNGVELSVLPPGGLSKGVPYFGWFTDAGIWPNALTRQERTKLRETAESFKIEIPTLSLDYCHAYSIIDPTADVRKKAIELVNSSIKLASDLGSKLALIHFGSNPVVCPWDKVKESLSECTKMGEEHDVKLGFESNMWILPWNAAGYHTTMESLVKMVEEIGSDYFGIYHHSAGVGLQPAKEVEMLGDKLVCTHLPSFKPSLNTDVDMVSLFRALKKIGYDWYVVLEVLPYPYSFDKSVLEGKKEYDKIMLKL